MPPIIEGFFLRLSPDESREVLDACEEAGFTRDAEGMKAMLLTMIREEENEESGSLAESIAEYIRNNPDQAAMAKAAVAQGFGALFKKFAGK